MGSVPSSPVPADGQEGHSRTAVRVVTGSSAYVTLLLDKRGAEKLRPHLSAARLPDSQASPQNLLPTPHLALHPS